MSVTHSRVLVTSIIPNRLMSNNNYVITDFITNMATRMEMALFTEVNKSVILPNYMPDFVVVREKINIITEET